MAEKEEAEVTKKTSINFMDGIRREKRRKILATILLPAGILQFLLHLSILILDATGWFLNIFVISGMDYRIWKSGWLTLLIAAILNLACLIITASHAAQCLNAGMYLNGEPGQRKHLLKAGFSFLLSFAATAGTVLLILYLEQHL